MSFKVIIAGSRDFNDYDRLAERMDFYLQNQSAVEIVSGTARGADKLGENYAAESRLPVARFPAKWDLYGRSAGYKRNAVMADYADALVAFWDGASRGTKHMINLAKEKNLKVRIVDTHRYKY